MPRPDLLALTTDDLASLSTRGKVKEALKDLDTGVTGQLTESAEGHLRIEWSDGRVSELPANATLRLGRCSCAAVDLCKHLVRLVLLYQRQQAVPAPPAESWDPGAIGDDELARHFRPSALEKARQVFEQGVLAELVRATRPVARFHLPACTVRFLVLGDLRYTRCDCARPSPCEHVPLAVWAFRRLDAEKRSGIITAGTSVAPAPRELLDALERMLADLACHGISGSSQDGVVRLSRLAARCEEADLIWPGIIVSELAQQQEAYSSHDARFEPSQVTALTGELAVRLDAIRLGTAVPQLLVRGTREDRPTKLGFGEYWGLGCGIQIRRKSVELAAHVYDTRAGVVLALTKQIANGVISEEKHPRSFAGLGGYVAVKGVSFATVGTGILQLQGGQRSPSHELLAGRGRATVHAQDRFAWEQIPPPVLVEELAELEDRFSSFPPTALRPRHLAENLHVLQIETMREPRFDSAAHCIQAMLGDRKGRQAMLVHPYTTRGRAGAEALLARLIANRGTLRFVAGLVSRSLGGLLIQPTCLIWEEAGRRTALQPWVARNEGSAEEESQGEVSETIDPVLAHVRQVQDELGELLILGLGRASAQTTGRIRELVRQGEGTGFSRLSGRLSALADALEEREHVVRWDASKASQRLLELTALLRLARDLAI